MLDALEIILGGSWGIKYGVLRRYWGAHVSKSNRIFSEPSHKRWKSADFNWNELGPDSHPSISENDLEERLWVIWCEKFDKYPSEVYRVCTQQNEPLFMRNEKDEVALL